MGVLGSLLVSITPPLLSIPFLVPVPNEAHKLTPPPDPDSTLGKLLKEATPLAPTERAALLYNSPSLEAAHSSSAQQGDTAAPAAEDIVELHFVAFVVVNGKLWELDGRRKGPICRGEVGDEDALGEKALEMGPRRFVGREEGELRFSVVALGPSLD